VTFSPNGQLLASGSDDTTARVWETVSWNRVRVLEGHTDYVRSVAFSPNGQLLVSGSRDSTLRFWDAANGECLYIFKGHVYSFNSVVFSPCGKQLASEEDDWTVRVWDMGLIFMFLALILFQERPLGAGSVLSFTA
jgi:WD40 repeat protein